MKTRDTSRIIGPKPPYKPVGRTDWRGRAESAESELARLRDVLTEFLRMQERSNNWLARQLRAQRGSDAPASDRLH